jgi:hypothetical protein
MLRRLDETTMSAVRSGRDAPGASFDRDAVPNAHAGLLRGRDEVPLVDQRQRQCRGDERDPSANQENQVQAVDE